MRDNNMLTKLIQLITIIILYYISGNNNLFLYASTLSLYNIYLSCFKHITLKEKFQKNKSDYTKFKILKYTIINIVIICFLFILLSILISDSINIFLKIDNTFLPYLIMSLSIITEPLTKIGLDYLESYNKTKISNNLMKLYYILEALILLIIAIISLKIFKLPIDISISLLYLSKIFSFLIVSFMIYLNMKKLNINLTKSKEDKEINYRKEVNEILKNNSHNSIVILVKNSYYYISLIILYTVLSTRYSYSIQLIENDLTYIYLYGICILNLITEVVESLTKSINKKENIINYLYIIFKNILTVAIIFGITSPLISKIIFNDYGNSIYLMMLAFLSIFIVLYNATFENIKSKKIIYPSLIVGIICKLILTIPLINSVYRMGYNLIYGDIVSTIIGMSISVAINYIYVKLNTKTEKTLEKILKTLYENILLCIILVLLQFIIPVKTDSYIKALFTLILYITVSVMFIKIKKKKRG